MSNGRINADELNRNIAQSLRNVDNRLSLRLTRNRHIDFVSRSNATSIHNPFDYQYSFISRIEFIEYDILYFDTNSNDPIVTLIMNRNLKVSQRRVRDLLSNVRNQGSSSEVERSRV